MRPFVIVGIVAAFVVVGVVVIVVLGEPAMSLDQILKNKDCEALDKWQTNLYDDNLNLSAEQKSGMMELALECGMKAIGNMFGK